MIDYPVLRPAARGGRPDIPALTGLRLFAAFLGYGCPQAAAVAAAAGNPEASRCLPSPRVAGSGRMLQYWSPYLG